MWYDLIELQRQWLRACHAGARHAAYGLWPDAASGCYADLLEPLLDLDAAAPPFAIGAIELAGRRIEVDDTVVAHTPFCSLRRFSRPGAQRAILLCAPLAGHAAVMMRETVETLLADGDVFITDWINARDVPLAAGRFGLDEYVSMLNGFIDALPPGGRPAHVVAVCQATFPSLGAIALRAQRGAVLPASVTLIGGPLDARINPSALGIAARSHSLAWCRDTLIDVVPSGFAGRGRHVFPAYLQRAEIAIAYPQRYLALLERYRLAVSSGNADSLATARRALHEYLALVDMPAEYFLDTVDIVFQRACLASRTWNVRGVRVEPAALRDIVLTTVEGTRDAVTGAGQTHAALDMCSGLAPGARQRIDVEGCDHYGLFTGERWSADVHPALQAVFARAEHGQRRSRAA
ncbi:polyhydroxyalkanoate depolymerase [Burkholderia cepacia]|uniref:Polyhydroxyalkanoate depolymerase n=1 Tax=Burkholderia cepacia TaxID=292 RepID=A0A2S8I6B9_BURCE|nr:polyhydroxyalkanoate depolymerase [Burkholderia cepacia]PQP10245.1 polyhydroxyalkanoate depolymerase [Burkholderia cepacia]HDR9512046.1 polyhydroxyalkanoate depolymerase [Burkholderia cepacia]